MFKIKTKSTIVAAFVLATLLFGCSKSFINDVRPTDSASPTDVYQSSASVRVFFNGIYRNMRSQWQSIDPTVATSTDAWGYNSVFMARTAKGKDFTMTPTNNWYFFDYQNDNREPTYRRVRFTWYFFYELINQLNTLIDGTTKSTTITEAEKPLLIAEAKALQANLYYELAHEFQFPYLKDPSAKGVPYYSQPAGADNLEGNGRGTLAALYDSINANLTYALANLTTDRELTSQVNLNVAEGIAARIFLEEGKYTEAADAAEKAIDGFELDASGYQDNWNNLDSKELLWVFPQTTENGGQSLYYGTPSSFFEKSGDGYDNFYPSKDLVEKFSITDIRNTFFVNGTSPADYDYYGTNKFGTGGTGTGIELLNGDQVELKTLDFNETLNMMRVGEMYLIRAEALAKSGDDATAGDVLFELQSDRDPDAVKSGKTGAALIDEILLERRKELYGEMGIDWSDAKRLQLPIDRTGSNHPAGLDYVIPANDNRFNLKLPQIEIQANKALTADDQNQ